MIKFKVTKGCKHTKITAEVLSLCCKTHTMLPQASGLLEVMQNEDAFKFLGAACVTEKIKHVP